jgi:phosphoribosylglycinamide formyltransferase 1
MFEKLQRKWRVSGVQLALILVTFAIGGSVTGFLGKKILNLLNPRQDWFWTLIYILLVIVIWPIAVLIVSLFFGQYRFFSGYVSRLMNRLGVGKASGLELRAASASPDDSIAFIHSESDNRLTTNDYRLKTGIAIFASGAGSNAQKIIDHFRNSNLAKIALVICNKPGAGVLDIATRENIPSILIEKERFFRGDGYLAELHEKKIEFIVLAGFLWKIPGALLKAYPRKIINIHPALLPKFGGKGMYGQFVHKAVLDSKEKESGITIHYVDEHYDNGDIILQIKCPVLENDTEESLAQRIHALEHANYPLVIEDLLRNLSK